MTTGKDGISEGLSIGVILASVRAGRRGEALARWTVEALARREGVRAEVLDLLEWPIPSYDQGSPPQVLEKSYAEGTLLARWRDTIAARDAFVIVTPEYNHGYPGQLKNALDAISAPWHRKPVSFVSYGGFSGGARAVEQLRQVAVELRMAPLRDEVNLRLIGLHVDERGHPTDELYAKRAALMADDLLWWGRVLKHGRS